MSSSRTLWNRRIRVRDGIEIAADVILPSESGPFPTVALRTPYGRSRAIPRGTPFVDRGYAVVFVDVRGRGDSEGTWRPFVKDVNDAYDVVEWIAAQSWSTGKIGMIGGSYEGLTQWWAAAGRPPHLSCIVPQAIGCVRESTVPHTGTGIPALYWLWWMTMVMGRTMQNGGSPSWEDQILSLPLRGLDKRLGLTSSRWQSYIAGEMEYLSADFALTHEQLAAIDVPVLIGVGWWDDQTTLAAWHALQNAKSASDCRLLVGAWDHAGNAVPRPVLGGLDVSRSLIDMPDYIEKFLAMHLKGETNEMTDAPRCHVFQTGSYRWDDLEDWPPHDTTELSLYLASQGDARSLRGSGRLVREPPNGAAVFDQFTYDPNNPAREMVDMAAFVWSDPPLDSRYTLRRQDVLVYDTAVMLEPLTISGRVRFVLFVCSDREDTDLFTSIFDVEPDGRSIALGAAIPLEGALRLSHREGLHAKPLRPGNIVEIHINGVWLHHVVMCGHRLRVAISSSRFPFYSRNAGTCEFWADATTLVPQTNTLYHSAVYPSRVLLPIIVEKPS